MAVQTEAALTPPESKAFERAPTGAWVSLLVLIALGLYTYMDRQIFGLQVVSLPGAWPLAPAAWRATSTNCLSPAP